MLTKVDSTSVRVFLEFNGLANDGSPSAEWGGLSRHFHRLGLGDPKFMEHVVACIACFDRGNVGDDNVVITWWTISWWTEDAAKSGRMIDITAKA